MHAVDWHKKPGVDLGFYKGGCPIHLKGAPEVQRRRRRRGEVWKEGCAPSAEIFFVFLISQESPANAKGTRDSSACMKAHCEQM